MSFIELQQVSKHYNNGEPVLTAINVAIEQGEFFVLVGPSGSGKSTLLRLLAGLDNVTTGTIMMDGQDVTQYSPQQRNISMVFQNYALYPHLTVADNILFGLKRKGVAKAEQQRRLQQSVTLLGLNDYVTRKPKALSGGQRQRVALARAIVSHAPLCLMDEPLSNLDAQLRAQMRIEIRALQKKLGLTTIYVTHDQTEAMTMGDRIMVINNGEIQQVGTPLTLYNQPANQFVASFIGAPKINFIGALVQGTTLILEQGTKLELNAQQVKRLPQNQSIVVGVRPENIVSGTTLTANITGIEQLGHETHVNVQMGERLWTLKWNGQHALQIRQKLSLDMQHCLFFDELTGQAF